jgi:hypothetical protein
MLTRKRARVLARYPNLSLTKLRTIDFCFEQLGCQSFADLGGVWGIDGAYARYAADAHEPERGVVVDENFTDRYLELERKLPALAHVGGNFGDRDVAAQIGQIDAAMFFDDLLHQVNPNWDEILEIYAPITQRFAIVQPQWNGSETVRLLDLGEEAYLAAIPKREDAHGSIYDGLFDRLDETNETRGRPWRDVHDIWQWGITDRDLIARMAELGFGVRYFENTGAWQGLERFHDAAFVFDRATPADRATPPLHNLL